MDWYQVLTIAGSTVSACLWMHKENKELAKDFAKESKDFHGRLCVLEERYINMMQKFLEEK